MRHRHSRQQTGRTRGHYRAMFRNLSASLVEHEIIRTTVPRAKKLRQFIEPLITLAKKDSVANRRLVFNRLRNRVSVLKLFNYIAPRYESRFGGYTRVMRCGFRPGDCAPMAYIELVDRPEDDDRGDDANR